MNGYDDKGLKEGYWEWYHVDGELVFKEFNL